MAIQFGKTWWGEHWLRSLENVDYNNRLPRDASYARHGHVLSVKINGNEMQAKVKGSRATPYRVVHFDLWWNPAVENQATYRAYRIGQKKNVMV